MRVRIVLLTLASCLFIADAASAQIYRRGWYGGYSWDVGPYSGMYVGPAYGYYGPSGYYYSTPYAYTPGTVYMPGTVYTPGTVYGPTTAYSSPLSAMQPASGVMQASAATTTTTMPAGMRISEVLEGAAKKANLHVGDIITAVGSTKTQTFDELQRALASSMGEVELTYMTPGSDKPEKTKITPMNGKIGVAVLPTMMP